MSWSDFEPSFRARLERMRFGLLVQAKSYADLMTSSMRSEAPWTNRSGDARRLITALSTELDRDPNNYSVGITAAHGVAYGVFLETRRANIRQETRDGVSGPWTMILRPVVARYRPRYFQDAQELVRRTLRGQ